MEATWESLRAIVFDRDGALLTVGALAGATVLVITAAAGALSDWWQHRPRTDSPSRWRAMWANMKPPYRPHRPGRTLAAVAAVGWPVAFGTLQHNFAIATTTAAVATAATVTYLWRRLRWARWLERRETEVAEAVQARAADTDRIRLVGPVTVVMPRRFPNTEGRL
jgi:hypothetical protein